MYAILYVQIFEGIEAVWMLFPRWICCEN